MRLRPLIRGLISYIPIIKQIIPKTGTGGSSSSKYCYSVWMRHLIHLESCGLNNIPVTVGEIGPGDSIGIGLAALLSGVKNYYALDLVRHTELNNNLILLEELAELFKSKTLIPNGKDFELVNPKIESTALPLLLKNYDLGEHIHSEIVKIIKRILKGTSEELPVSINYFAPWQNRNIIQDESCDLILSQAVMEHICDLDYAYESMYYWLKPGGFISHQIDFKAHETHNDWYGHYTYSDLIWKIIMHGRKYYINRFPLSAHIKAIEKQKFNIIKIIPNHSQEVPKIDINKKPIKYFNKEDIITTSALIIARK